MLSNTYMSCWGFLLRLLIQAGYELDVQDHDGWTPLHAAAHWGVKEACSILAEALCNMDVRNKLVSEPSHRHRHCWRGSRTAGSVSGGGPAPCPGQWDHNTGSCGSAHTPLPHRAV